MTLVQPVALRYPHEDGAHPHVPFVDDPNIIKHAFQIMCAKTTTAEVTLCIPIISEGKMRKQLSQSARTAIANVVEN